MAHIGAQQIGLVGAVDPDLTCAATEAVEHVGVSGETEGVGAVHTAGVGLLQQLGDVETPLGVGRTDRPTPARSRTTIREPFQRVIWCLPSEIVIRYGSRESVTDGVLTQPRLPFGRIGSATCVQPGMRRRTRKTSCEPSAFGLARTRNSCFASGLLNTATLAPRACATMLTPTGPAAEAAGRRTAAPKRGASSASTGWRSPRTPPPGDPPTGADAGGEKLTP